MNNVLKYALIIIGLNILAILLCIVIGDKATDIETGITVIFFVPAGLLLIQLIIGIVFAAGNKRTELGKAILMAVGFILLVGLSLCGLTMI